MTTSNPYAPPNAELQSNPEAARTVQAYLSDKENRVLGRRFLGAWIDYLVCFGFLLIPETLLGNALYQKTLWVWLIVMIAYFPLMEGLTGYSAGKFIARARVVDANGNIPGIKKATIRTLLRLFEVNPFLMGGIPAGLAANFSKYGQRLGDMAAGTYVVASGAVEELKS